MGEVCELLMVGVVEGQLVWEEARAYPRALASCENRTIGEESRKVESGSGSPKASSGEWPRGCLSPKEEGVQLPKLLCLGSCPDTISTLSSRLLAGLTLFQCPSELLPTSVHFHILKHWLSLGSHSNFSSRPPSMCREQIHTTS